MAVTAGHGGEDIEADDDDDDIDDIDAAGTRMLRLTAAAVSTAPLNL
jgi:hypothetical protein